jgi:hypothetical protein
MILARSPLHGTSYITPSILRIARDAGTFEAITQPVAKRIRRKAAEKKIPTVMKRDSGDSSATAYTHYVRRFADVFTSLQRRFFWDVTQGCG